jgi:hypothetical protein
MRCKHIEKYRSRTLPQAVRRFLPQRTFFSPRAVDVDRTNDTRTNFSQSMLAFLLLITGVAQLNEALQYKQEGRGFDTRWRNWDFLLT